MTPLDAARRLMDSSASSDDQCPHCGQYIGPLRFHEAPAPHAADCPWLALPKIVAALELVEQIDRLHRQYPRTVWDHPSDELVDRLCALVEDE